MAAEGTQQEWEWLATIEDGINSTFDPVADAVASVIFYAPTIGGVTFPLIVLWLVVAAIVFTIYFRGIQFRSWTTSMDLVRGKFSRASDPGEVTHFQALSSASATSRASAPRSRSAAPVRRSG